MKVSPPRAIIALLLAAVFSAHANITLVNTDFENAALGEYTHGTIINNGSAPYEQMTVIKIPLTTEVAFTSKVEVVEYPSGNKSLAITAPLNSGSGYIRTGFPAPTRLSTTERGNNFIEGNLDFTITSNAGEVNMMFNRTRDDFETNFTTMSFRIEQNRNFRSVFYLTGIYGGQQQNHITSLDLNVPYRLSFHFDMSDGIDFIYGYKILRLSDNHVVFQVSNLQGNRFRSPLPPDRFVIGITPRNSATTPPFIHFDNFHITARNKIRPTLFLLK